MPPAVPPRHEAERIEALRRSGVLDTPPEAFFDEITLLASEICQTPIALVSLVDRDRQWFKSRVGLEATETPRDFAFCAHSIIEPEELLEVADATRDPRFADNPLVTSSPGIRFYAGAPLVTPEGLALGTLCVIDRKANALSDQQRSALRALARAVSNQLELRRTVADLRTALGEAQRSRRQLSAQQAVLNVLVSSRSPTAAATDIARAFGAALEIEATALWLVSPSRDRLQCAGAWVRDGTLEPFIDATLGRAFRPGEGLPGRVLATADWVSVPDLAADANCPLGPVAGVCGLATACAAPVLGEAGVLGALEAFSRSREALGDEYRVTMEILGRQVGLAIERERAEGEVAAKEARTHAIVDSALDCVITIDAEGRVTEYNPAAERTFGWQRGDIIGHMLADSIIPPRFREAHRAGLARYVATNEAKLVGTRFEIVAVKADGTEFPVELGLMRMPGAGPVEVTAFLRDITDRTQARDAMRLAKEKAETDNRAKSDFLAVMSHEIRTPMNAILGMTELALDQETRPDQRDLLETVQSNAEDLLDIVSEILDDSKIQSGQLEVSLEPCVVGDVLESVADALTARASAKGLELICDVTPSVPAGVLADPHRLRQILLNMASNAVKFTAQGTVLLALTAERVDDESSNIRFVVRDTGPGIPQEALGQIFDRYFQADSSATRAEGGTGLGLSICRALVELMGGRIDVESEPGRGTTFQVVIPMRHAQVTGARRRRVDRAFGDVRTTIASPAGAARDALVHGLARFGISATCLDSAEALSLPQSDHGDLLILDERLIPKSGATGDVPVDVPAAPGQSRILFRTGSPLPGGAGPRGWEILAGPITRRRLGALLVRLLDHDEPPVPLFSRDRAIDLAHVLLVDDNRDNIGVASRTLERAGHRVDIARNGREALDQYRRVRYDLVLTDVAMPEMDGFSFARAVRDIERDRGDDPVPIVAVTAHATAGFRERCLEAGMNDYVAKPVKGSALLGKVRQWADVRPVVLVADDDADNRELVRRFLGDADYRVVPAANGREALTEFARQRVSIVLLDMQMPLMDGYEVATALRASAAGATVPIIAITGSEGPAEERRGREAGCNAHLAKPLQRARLQAVVMDALAARHAADGRSERPAPDSAAPASPELVHVDPDLADLVPRYLAARLDDVHAAQACLAADDFSAIASIGHNLKGTGAAYGFLAIGTLGLQIEHAAHAADRALIEKALQELEVYVAQVSWAPSAPPSR